MLDRLFARWRPRPGLPPELANRIERWRALPECDLAARPGRGRWVVVDVESSGLDPRRDALISIGALAVTDGEIDVADSFETVLRQSAPSHPRNIEIHGIGDTEQLEGAPPAEVLCAFLEFIGKAPLVGFHAGFDAAVLRRAIEGTLRVGFRRPWVDLAHIAPLAWPKLARGRTSLDAWLEALSIPAPFRHRAIGDCLATAQLLVMALPFCPQMGAANAGLLVSLSGVEA